METDIMLLDGKHRRLTAPHKVRVDLACLNAQELLHLRNGIDSALAHLGTAGGRCWHVPADAVEVFVAK
jgi:hypothetical protein